MATSIAQCCFLRSRCSSYTRLMLQSVKPGILYENTLFRHCIHQTQGYGNRGADLPDIQVDIPVDKVNTKAEVRFHVRTADWIPEDIRQKIIEKNKSRINKAGELLVTSELSRSQHRNLDNCIQKICDIIAEASEKPHEPTAEDIALRAARLEKRNKERLKLKKIHSATKQNRQVDFD